jgi:hypothetical protein
MQDQITVDIPGEIKIALDEAVRSEGISSNELVGRALKQYLFLRRFRLLSDRLTAKAQSQGILSEQDVFDRVS